MATKPAADEAMSPFFKLAREIRDQIYEECLIDVHGPQLGSAFFRYYVKRHAASRLLLVCRQFSAEYEERAKALRHCRIAATSRIVPSATERSVLDVVALGNLASTRIRSFQVDLAFPYRKRHGVCHAVAEHDKWVSQYVGTLTSLQSLKIRVVVVVGPWPGTLFHEATARSIEELNQDYWLQLKHLKQLELYTVPCSWSQNKALKEFGPQHTLVAKLSKETGKVEEIKD